MTDLMKLARSRPCAVRSPICNGDPETTVAAHFRSQRLGAGVAIKPHPMFCAHACERCHSLIDGRVHIDGYTKDDIRLMHAMGVLETQKRLIDEGYIKIGGKT